MRPARPPRPCGNANDELRLDRPNDAALAQADPDLAISLRKQPLLIDEWQLVPQVLPAVKRAIDGAAGANRYILTGSSQADLTSHGWAATGRVIRVAMWGLTQRELRGDGAAAPFVDRLVEHGPDAINLGSCRRGARSGFPG